MPGDGSTPGPPTTAVAKADGAALKEAESSGKPVEVIPRRTETSSVFANPSGTFTEERYALPQRVKKNHALVDIDTALAPAEDGRISPAATPVKMSFSPGGDGPLATIERDGRRVSLSWPKALPKAQVSGNTVTYPEVLPDVDLKVRASATGFGQLLVVRSPRAAADPALKAIQYGMSADGVKVSVDQYGNLTGVNPAGQVVFSGPTPRMWDSSGPAQNADTAQQAARSAPLARTAALPAPAPADDEFQPGQGARTSEMKVAVTPSNLKITPDTGLLTGKDTTYPVFIDPYVDGARQAWALVYKKYANSAFYNGAGWIDRDGTKGTSTARIGYENETDGLGRSFFQLNTKNLWDTDKRIIKSTFRIKNTWSWSCEDRETQLWDTGSISSGTTWNNQPSWTRKVATTSETKGWAGSTSCPAGNLAFDVTSGTKEAAASHWTNWTLGLRAATETSVYSWKKFDAKSAVLSTEYTTPPSTPTDYGTSPATECRAKQTSVIGNSDVQLYAKISDPDGGTVKARFNMWIKDGDPAIFNQTVSVTSGNVARVTVPKSVLKDGAVHQWQVRADDGTAVSPWAPAEPCRFTIDTSRPGALPVVSSTEYPDGGNGWPAATGTARTPGSFTIASGGVGDVTKYEYWNDWDTTRRTVSAASPGGSVSVKVTPMSVGVHKLYARSLDKAGNPSDIQIYFFYANSPKIADRPGDLNGDGNSDLYGIRTNGDLRLYAGTGNGGVGPATVVSNENFTGALITHRGDWTGDGYEDLISARPQSDGTKKLFVHPNNGLGYACTKSVEVVDGQPQGCPMGSQELRVYDPTHNHWNNAQQIVAIGDVDGPTDLDNDGTPDIPSFPDLLVKEGDHLWLYYGSSSWYLDETDPVLIGDGGWTDFDVIAPGDVTGDGRVDLVTRRRSSGEIYVYPGSGPAGEGLGDGSTRQQFGQHWTAAYRPLIASGGDADNDGVPDLWATTTDNAAGLLFYPKITTRDHGSPFAVGTGGWGDFTALS
ncbi:FG-GAP-like repeat-containing protein [Streptomyces sp. NPDC037389]|uniref:FG-GAP-like repeat-containing protein n=1 Tax=Streptomyces sp. NPDC037389 TaxID=3155369 RepID=UPI0034105B3D